MTKKNKVIPARDANENTKAYRERMKAEAEEARKKELAELQKKQEEEAFRKFVTEKREDYVMTTLGAILQNHSTDKTKVAENVGLACEYADTLLHKLYNVRKVNPAKQETPENGAPDPGEQPQTAIPKPKSRKIRAGGPAATKE